MKHLTSSILLIASLFMYAQYEELFLSIALLVLGFVNLIGEVRE